MSGNDWFDLVLRRKEAPSGSPSSKAWHVNPGGFFAVGANICKGHVERDSIVVPRFVELVPRKHAPNAQSPPPSASRWFLQAEEVATSAATALAAQVVL
jgi:hypothetical protein